MRLTKKIGNTNYTYLYEGGLLVQETRGDEIFDYSYDANGSIRMLKHRATESATPTYYYYALNSRNDVVGLYNSSGAVYAKYTYDPWGNITSVTNASGTAITDTNNIAHTQPFRYRSYYYDTDSKFYYLQSRYYDPLTHRFINADGLVSTGTGVLGHNMFAYCNNNPVNYVDITGENAEALAWWSSTMWWLCGIDSALPIGDIIYFGVMIGLGVAASSTQATAPSISLPSNNYREKEKTKSKEKESTKSKPRNSDGTTYYHSTTTENAASIMLTNTMCGSSWEGGYVYAWKTKPNKYAIDNSGARTGVIISFKTNAAFTIDTGINDPKVQKFGPVVSVNKGPIVVWDVRIEGYYR